MQNRALAHATEAQDRRGLVERAYADLRRRIIRNELTPGTKLIEAEVAVTLGISRTPVREALLRLEGEGLVEATPPRGMQVKPLSARDVREINEVLACLEAEAASRLAASRPGPEVMAQLDAAIAAMDAALAARDHDAWSEADYRFHCLLVELAGNRHLAETARLFLDRAHRVRLLTTRLREPPVYSNANHAAVVEAIRRGDAETALDIHRAHKRRWSRELDRLLDRLGLRD